MKEVIKYTRHTYMDKCFYKDTVEYIVIPGKFDCIEAGDITRLLNNGFRIPTVIECTSLLNEIDLLDSFITSEIKELGEDGNFIYTARRGMNLYKVLLDGDYVYDYKRHPVRNSRYSLILIKTLSRCEIDTWGRSKEISLDKPLQL